MSTPRISSRGVRCRRRRKMRPSVFCARLRACARRLAMHGARGLSARSRCPRGHLPRFQCQCRRPSATARFVFHVRPRSAALHRIRARFSARSSCAARSRANQASARACASRCAVTCCRLWKARIPRTMRQVSKPHWQMSTYRLVGRSVSLRRHNSGQRSHAPSSASRKRRCRSSSRGRSRRRRPSLLQHRQSATSLLCAPKMLQSTSAQYCARAQLRHRVDMRPLAVSQHLTTRTRTTCQAVRSLLRLNCPRRCFRTRLALPRPRRLHLLRRRPRHQRPVPCRLARELRLFSQCHQSRPRQLSRLNRPRQRPAPSLPQRPAAPAIRSIQRKSLGQCPTFSARRPRSRRLLRHLSQQPSRVVASRSALRAHWSVFRKRPQKSPLFRLPQRSRCRTMACSSHMLLRVRRARNVSETTRSHRLRSPLVQL